MQSFNQSQFYNIVTNPWCKCTAPTLFGKLSGEVERSSVGRGGGGGKIEQNDDLRARADKILD